MFNHSIFPQLSTHPLRFSPNLVDWLVALRNWLFQKFTSQSWDFAFEISRFWMEFASRFNDFCSLSLPLTVERWNKVLFICFMISWTHFFNQNLSKPSRKSSNAKFMSSTLRALFSALRGSVKIWKSFSDSSMHWQSKRTFTSLGKVQSYHYFAIFLKMYWQTLLDKWQKYYTTQPILKSKYTYYFFKTS